MVMIIMWFAILGDRTEVGGYARGDFIVYFLFMTLGWYIVGGSFSREIGRAIRNGDLNKYLLQPYHLVLKCFFRELAWKAVSLAMSLPLFLGVLYLLRGYLSWQMFTGPWWQVALSLLLGSILFALMEAIIGSLAFWVTEIWPFAEMNEMLLNFFGGVLAPISLLPMVVQKMSVYTPFRYIFYEPVAIALGKEGEPVKAILIQVLYIVVVYVVYKLVWKQGLHKYEGNGG